MCFIYFCVVISMFLYILFVDIQKSSKPGTIVTPEINHSVFLRKSFWFDIRFQINVVPSKVTNISLLKSECVLLNVGHHEEHRLPSHLKSHSYNHENDLPNEEGKMLIFCSGFVNCSIDINIIKIKTNFMSRKWKQYLLTVLFLSRTWSFFIAATWFQLLELISVYTSKQWYALERFSHFSEKLVGPRDYTCWV